MANVEPYTKFQCVLHTDHLKIHLPQPVESQHDDQRLIQHAVQQWP